jgi:thiamine biosynthesis lipoprotein
MRRMRRTPHIVVCLLLVVVASCSTEPEALITGNTMGTTYTVRVPGAAPPVIERIKNEIEQTLADVNAAMSTWQPDSVINQFNSSTSTDWFDVPASFTVVADASIQIAEQSHGAFDPTVGPMVQRWGFGSTDEQSIPPTADELQQLKAVTGYRHLEVRLQPPAVRKSIPQLQLDFSAIAKGYAVDRLAQIVRNAGYTSYLVEIGGELRISGHNANSEPWKIGVEYPDADGTSVQSALFLNGGGVASSGDYRNFRNAAGRRYSHIIDPRTAAPVSHELAAVTVVANNAMYADGWATALMVLGAEQGQQVAAAHSLAAMLVEGRESRFAVLRSELFSQLRTESK